MVKRGIGTTIPSIKKQDLEELTVEIPPLNVQGKLVSLKSLCEKEKQLSTDLVNKKEILYQSLFNKIVKGELK
jgi:restriction endonuclease S subunit